MPCGVASTQTGNTSATRIAAPRNGNADVAREAPAAPRVVGRRATHPPRAHRLGDAQRLRDEPGAAFASASSVAPAASSGRRHARARLSSAGRKNRRATIDSTATRAARPTTRKAFVRRTPPPNAQYCTRK